MTVSKSRSARGLRFSALVLLASCLLDVTSIRTAAYAQQEAPPLVGQRETSSEPKAAQIESPAATPAPPPALVAPKEVDAKPVSVQPQVMPLPQDLSPLRMFLSADLVVQSVMVSLMLASIAAWSVWLAKIFELASLRGRLRRGVSALGSARSISNVDGMTLRKPHIVAELLATAREEIEVSQGGTAEGIKERVSSRLAEIERMAVRRMRAGTGLLASIGATAPFVGLFGTVWGIMNSFIGISRAQTTNLAVVAPGIAEALLATAIGLIAAIPAVLFYNHLTRSTAANKALLGDAIARVERLVSRDLDREPAHRAAVRDQIKLAAE